MAYPLVSAAQLRVRLDDNDLVVIDCRWDIDDPDAGRTAYLASHIPGARFVDLEADLSDTAGRGRHPLPTHEAFGALCGSLGIDRSVQVVAYDDRGGAIAARLWWMLTNQGHPEVSVLDGGLVAWEAIDGPMSGEIPAVERRSFPTRPWCGTVDRDEVAARRDSVIIIDARSPERYRGDEEPIDPVAGHIPGSLSVPYERNLNEDMTFRSPAELRRHFAATGVSEAAVVISHCGSGVTACHNILAMVLAGLPIPDLYVGSWSDWSTADMPVAIGNNPG